MAVKGAVPSEMINPYLVAHEHICSKVKLFTRTSSESLPQRVLRGRTLEPATRVTQKAEEEKNRRHSQQLRPQDHGDVFARVVAAETQAEKMAGASLPRAEHAGRGSDGGQAEVLGLAGAHRDLVPQGVVDDGVTVLAGKEGKRGEH